MSEITVQEIMRKLQRHYDPRPDSPQRPLHVYKSHDSYETVGSVFFSLEGSPPKGYGIYVVEHRLLSLYDNRGKRFRIINCDITDLDKLKNEDILKPRA